MAGRITYRAGPHPSVKAAWAPLVSLSASEVEHLADRMGRDLTCKEVARLENLLTTSAGMKEAPLGGSSQDVKETLRALSRLPDDAVCTSAERADARTRASLCDALLRMGVNEPWKFVGLKSAMIQAAALYALHTHPKASGGAPIKGYRVFFAAGFVSIWSDIVGETPAIHSWDGGASPAVECAQFLLAKINDHLGASAVASILRKVSC